MKRIQIAIVAIAVAIPMGFVGAWAFNPDSGTVFRSYTLWRVFGVMAELGGPLVLLLVIVGGILGRVHGRRS